MFRVLLLAAAVFLYFFDVEMLDFTNAPRLSFGGAFLWVVWIVFAVEMLYRLIPNKKIAAGARKHFSSFYKGGNKGKKTASHMQLHRGAVFSGLGWLLVTAGVLYGLFVLQLLTPAAVLIIALVYSVADLVFILFFCPFQTLFMHNHCCVDCRIYNWDYFMMFAPLALFPSFYSVVLVILATAVLVRWEISVWKNPHFFTRETNENLRCEACADDLCQLRTSPGKR